LLLARTEAQAGRRLARKLPADLATGAASALSAVGPELRRTSIEVQADLGASPVVGDASLLERLAGNLIENAVRYNHLHGKLWVRTGTDATHSWLVVGNTGFEVDPADVPALFEPFRRGGRARTGGRRSRRGGAVPPGRPRAHRRPRVGSRAVDRARRVRCTRRHGERGRAARRR